MTRDEMMRLLQECGFGTLLDHPIMTENMMRFGLLVAAAEREQCALIAESYEPRCDICPSGVSTAIRARGEQK